jgi:uracil-DNA glycosylase
MALIDKNTYKYQSWKDFLKTKSIDNIYYGISWHILFSQLKKHKKYPELKSFLQDRATKETILPQPSMLFNAFRYTNANNLKVVILGQDPYINYEVNDSKVNVPEATGFSFSIPKNMTIPPSLKNIYKNLYKYKHIAEIPEDGNLWFWACQGVLMLNTSLTVAHKKSNSHKKYWAWFTRNIIEYISNNFENIVFLIWGGSAYKKIEYIDLEKHHAIISSHPSPLGAYNKFKHYPPFVEQDHFGLVNQYLIEHDKKPIMW